MNIKQIVFLSMLLSTTSFAAHFEFLDPSIFAKTNAVVSNYMARIDSEITSKRDEYKNILRATVNKKLPFELTETEKNFIISFNIDLSRPIESIWYMDIVWGMPLRGRKFTIMW